MFEILYSDFHVSLSRENDEEMGLAKEDERITPEPPSPQKSTLERIFIDIAGDGEIGWSELKQLLDHSMRDVMDADQKFSKDMCRSMVAMMDADSSGKLGFSEFEILLNDIAKWKVSGGVRGDGQQELWLLILKGCILSN